MNKSLLEIAETKRQHDRQIEEDKVKLAQEQENYRTYKLMEASFYKLLPDNFEPSDFTSEYDPRSSGEKRVRFHPVYGHDNPERCNSFIEYMEKHNSLGTLKDVGARYIEFYAEFNGYYFEANIPILLENETLSITALRTYLKPYFELWNDTYMREVELDKLDKEYEERRKEILGEA